MTKDVMFVEWKRGPTSLQQTIEMKGEVLMPISLTLHDSTNMPLPLEDLPHQQMMTLVELQLHEETYELFLLITVNEQISMASNIDVPQKTL
jgi:hypothetical protein